MWVWRIELRSSASTASNLIHWATLHPPRSISYYLFMLAFSQYNIDTLCCCVFSIFKLESALSSWSPLCHLEYSSKFLSSSLEMISLQTMFTGAWLSIGWVGPLRGELSGSRIAILVHWEAEEAGRRGRMHTNILGLHSHYRWVL